MQRRKQIFVLLLLASAAILFYVRSRDDKVHSTLTAVAEVPPAVTENIWLRSAYEAAHEIEDNLLRDEILSRLVPISLHAGDSQFALAVQRQIQNEPRKVSALVELAISERRSGKTADYRLHMDSALHIADAIYKYEEHAGHAHMAIAAVLMRNGFVEDAVAVALPVCTNDPAWDFWAEWFRNSAEELALRGNIADARFTAASIPWPYEGTRAYINIASIQHRDGHKPGARKTLLEAIERVGDVIEPNSKAYSYALIAAASARMGDHTNATNLYAVCQGYLPLGNSSPPQVSGATEVIARTFAELARTSCQLGDPQEARRWLELAGSWSRSIGDSEAAAAVRCDIAEVLMSMGEMDAALAIADEMRDTVWHTLVLGCIIAHESFPADSEMVDRVLGSVSDEDGRADVALCLVLSFLRHGRIAEAESLALTIREGMYKDEAFSRIVENLCENGSMKRAIQVASDMIRDPWSDTDLFMLIGKSLSKTRSGAELHTILSEQTNHVRRASICIGIAQTLGDHEKLNN